MGGFPGQGGDGSADSLHVQKFSCECVARVIEARSRGSFKFHLSGLIGNNNTLLSSFPESNSSTNVDGDLTPTSQHRIREAEQ